MTGTTSLIYTSLLLLQVMAGPITLHLTSRQWSGLPACAQQCLGKQNDGNCSATDEQCACSDRDFMTGAANCFQTQCTDQDDFQSSTNLTITICQDLGVDVTYIRSISGDSTSQVSQEKPAVAGLAVGLGVVGLALLISVPWLLWRKFNDSQRRRRPTRRTTGTDWTIDGIEYIKDSQLVPNSGPESHFEYALVQAPAAAMVMSPSPRQSSSSGPAQGESFFDDTSSVSSKGSDIAEQRNRASMYTMTTGNMSPLYPSHPPPPYDPDAPYSSHIPPIPKVPYM